MPLAIYIDAGHNRNGNPRRGWIIADDDGSFAAFVDEGYEGSAALRRAGLEHVPRTTTPLQVTPATYQRANRGHLR